MIDIVSVTDDIGVFDTKVPQSANLLSVQVGSLEYAPSFGIDMNYFLSEIFVFQNASFLSYLIQVLANFGINASEVQQAIQPLFEKYTFFIERSEPADGLIVR